MIQFFLELISFISTNSTPTPTSDPVSNVLLCFRLGHYGNWRSGTNLPLCLLLNVHQFYNNRESKRFSLSSDERIIFIALFEDAPNSPRDGCGIRKDTKSVFMNERRDLIEIIPN